MSEILDLKKEILGLIEQRNKIDAYFERHEVERGINKRNHINKTIKELHDKIKSIALQSLDDSGDITDALEIGLKLTKRTKLVYDDGAVLEAAKSASRSDLLNVSLNKAAIKALFKDDSGGAYALGINSTVANDFTIPNSLK